MSAFSFFNSVYVCSFSVLAEKIEEIVTYLGQQTGRADSPTTLLLVDRVHTESTHNTTPAHAESVCCIIFQFQLKQLDIFCSPRYPNVARTFIPCKKTKQYLGGGAITWSYV